MKECKYLLSLFLFLFVRIASFAQVTSTFDTNVDGWSTIVISSSATFAPNYINSGGNPGGYISVSLTNPSTPFYFYADRYFDAPVKFLGNKSTSYNQNLTFDLQQSLNGTDLSTAEVVLTGAGLSVFLPATIAPANSSWSSYSVLLKETAGWKTGSVAGAATTKTEMKLVLSNLTSLRIKAQYFPGFPVGTYLCLLDNVILNQSAITIAPVISSFTPTSGNAGTTITINGNNFNTTPAQNVVNFNGVKGTVVTASATQLTVLSPSKISYGPIAVTNLANGAQGASGQNFNPLFDNNKDFGARVIPSTFAKKVDFGTSTEIGLSVGDLDGDGLIDVLTSSSSLNASVFRNLGQTGAVNASSFASPLVLSIPNSPVVGVVQRVGQNSIADMDGDGKLDLVVNVGYSCCGGNWDNSFVIFLNQSTPGALSFASGSIFQFATVNNNNEGIAVADMDGDGRPELLGALGNSACALGIAQNLSTPGNLDFAAFQNFGLGATFGGNISFGDLNGDTKPEIILEAYLSGAINVYENTSTSGTISLSTPFLISNVTTSNIEVADLDNDGKNELIFKEYFANQVHIKKNNYASGPLSAASFSADVLLPSSYNTGGNVNEYTAVADVNGDNKPDIVANDGSNVMVYQNNYSSGVLSASSFVGGIAFEGDSNFSNRFVFCADIDGDNKPEILTQPQTNFNFRVYRNESYPAPKINSVSPSSGNAGTSISLAGNYFNTYSNVPQVRIGGIVTTGSSLSNTSVTTTLPLGIYNLHAQVTSHGLIGYSKPITPTFNGNQIINATSFSTGVDLPMTNNGNFGLAVADFDNDGRPDIVADDSDVGKVFQNTLSTTGANILASSFTLSPTTLTGSRRLAAGDFDGDGKIDLVTGLNSLLQNSSTTQPSFLVGVSTNLNNAVVILTDHDFNLDGKPDLATVGSSGTQLSIFENLTRNGAFTPPGTNFASFGLGSGGPSYLLISLAGNGFGVSANDFDGDGYDDLAIGLTSTTSSLTVYQNTGLNLPITSAQFAPPVNFTANSSPSQIVTADLDGDGKIDAAIGYSVATLSIFKNQSTPGTISFAAKQDITAVAGVTTMAAQDLDGDGKPEIITTNFTGGVGSFSIFKNTSAGSISFALPVTFNLAAGRNPTNLSIADFNLDAKPDLVIRGSGSTANFVTVFQNNVATAPPTITNFSPANGPIGTTVTITGTNFDPTPGNNIVKFNGTTAVVLACSTTSISTLVPAGATTGTITVTVGSNTATSATNFTVTAHVPLSNVVLMNGSTDYIEVSNQSAIRPLSMTLEAWVNFSSLPPSGFAPLFNKVIGSGINDSYQLFYLNGDLKATVEDVVGFNTFAQIPWNPVLGQWYHVAFTYDDATRNESLYLDGVLVATNTVGASPQYDNSPLYIGGDRDNGTTYYSFPGKIDEARIWNVVRTSTEILSTINTSLSGNETGLAAYYKMDETGQGAGITVVNSAISSGAAINGTTFGTSCTPIFTLTPPPTFLSFAPSSGPIGTVVTITGTNFDLAPVNNLVTFNGVSATVTASTATSITVIVPPSTTTGTILVTVGCNTAASQSAFTVTTPTLTINTQPSDFTACEGDVATFTTAASGTTNIQYQWQFSVDGIVPFANISSNGAYSGATTATLSINTNNGFGEGRYRCQISGDGVSTVFTNDEGLFLKTLPSAIITANGTQLTASPGESYQWYQNGESIAGATNQSFEFNLLEYGLYKVDVTDNGCTSTSAPFEYLITGAEKFSSQLKVYPNPVDENLSIEFKPPYNVSVIDVTGKVLHQMKIQTPVTLVNLSDLSKGIYVLQIKNDQEQHNLRISKK